MAARQKWSETKLAVWVVCPPPVLPCYVARGPVGRVVDCMLLVWKTSRDALGVFVLHSHVVSHGLRTLGCHAFFTALCLASEKAVSRAFA